MGSSRSLRREAPTTKLTSDQRRKLLEDYTAGAPVKVIAERYGVTINYVTVLARRNGVPRNRREQQQQKRVERLTKEFEGHTKAFVGRIMRETRR